MTCITQVLGHKSIYCVECVDNIRSTVEPCQRYVACRLAMHNKSSGSRRVDAMEFSLYFTTLTAYDVLGHTRPTVIFIHRNR